MISAARPAVLAFAGALACACGTSGSTPVTPPADAGTDVVVVPRPCALAPVGSPIELVTFPDRSASAPSMVVVDPGDAASGRAASVALQVFANGGANAPDDIEIARIRVAPPWPQGTTLDQAPQLMGELSLGWGRIAATPPPAAGIALVWHRETVGVGRPQLRSLDVPSWTLGATVQLAPSGDAILALASGPPGFAVVWRDLDAPSTGPVVIRAALLDAAGNILVGPLPLTGRTDYPGPSASVAWSGDAFLVATGDRVRRSVVLSRLRATGGGGVDALGELPISGPTAVPASTSLVTHAGRVWLEWVEGDPVDASAPRTIRALPLDSQGKPVAGVVTVATDAKPTTSVALSAGDLGLLVSWAEDGAVAAPKNQPGRSRVVVRQLDDMGAAVASPLSLDATFVDAYGPPTSVALAAPKSAIVLWGGKSADATKPDVIYASRLDCAP